MNINFISITCGCLMVLASFQLSAQNKDIEHAKEKLKEAFKIKDPTKKGEEIQQATEMFQKGGLKTQQINVYLGDAYLEDGDLPHAEAKYGQCAKAEKEDGLNKVGDAYVAQAMSADEKNQPKLLDKAVKDYQKAGKLKEGCTGIGDKFYEKGEKFYQKAVDFYFKGADTASAIKIARDYEKKGADGMTPAFDLYKKCGMFKKAGDMAWETKQYPKAYDAYSAGDNTEGMRKCADKFYLLGLESEATNIYMKIVEIYSKTANTEAIEKLATENVKFQNYGVASRIYDKAGNLAQAKKYHAYDKFMQLDLDSAKLLFTEIGQPDLAKAVTTNIKALQPLKDVKAQFDDWAKQQPSVGLELDRETNQYKPLPKDEQMLVDYYKLIKDKITDLCAIVSLNVQAIKDPDLQKMLKKRFLEYPAVGKILNKETFSVEKTKSNTQVKDVYLRHL